MSDSAQVKVSLVVQGGGDAEGEDGPLRFDLSMKFPRTDSSAATAINEITRNVRKTLRGCLMNGAK